MNMKKELLIGLFFLLVIGGIILIQASECEDAGYNCRDGCFYGTETLMKNLSCSYQGGRSELCCRTIGANEDRGPCVDSDGGKDADIWGHTFNYVEDNPDFCLVAGGSFRYVDEYYCENNSINESIIECPLGCKNGACIKEGQIKNCIIENGEGTCEFSGKTYNVKNVVCDGNITLEVSYDAVTSYSGELFLGGLTEFLLKDGTQIRAMSDLCSNSIILSFEKYRELLTIIDYGTYRVYYGDKINFASVNAEIDEIAWALPGDTTPWIKINVNSFPESFNLKQNEERVFTYGAVNNPLSADLNIKVISFGLDEGSPTKSFATIELSPVETNEVLSPVETSGPVLRNESSQNFFCNGCDLESKCYPFGYRKSGRYCSDGREFIKQIQSGFCDNNFECKSNLCVNDECISRNFIQKIIDFFKNLFGAG